MSDDETQTQAHTGVSITGKVKRGTGTRDQDEIKIKGKGETAGEAIDNFEASLAAVEDQAWAERLRQLQPEADNDDD